MLLIRVRRSAITRSGASLAVYFALALSLGLIAWAAPAQAISPVATFQTSFGTTGSGPGQLNGPRGIASDGKGHVWVADRANDRVEEFDESGAYLGQFGSSGSGNGQFNEPWGIAVTAAGNLWVVDTENQRVQEFNEKGEFLQKFGTKATGGSKGTEFVEPEGIAIAPGGMLWISDNSGARIAEFRETVSSESERFVRNVATTGTGNPGLVNPLGLAVDAAGDLWAADETADRLIEYSSEGAFKQTFGSSGSGNGQFDSPKGVAVAPSGNILVVDWGNNRVQAFQHDGTFTYKFGTGGSGGENFNEPRGVAFGAENAVFITDTGNNHVNKWVVEQAPPAPQVEPIAAYSFDAGEGTVAEDVFGGHDGTIEGPTWAEGKYGSALRFDGEAEDNCVTVPNSPALQLTERFTMEAWARSEGSLYGDTILFKELESEGGPAYLFAVGFDAKGKLQGEFMQREEPEVVQEVLSPDALPEYKWTHVAFSFDGVKERLYINGELVATHATSIGAVPSGGPLEIGCAKGWESDYFWGKIDELRIYNRALPVGEIETDRDTAIQTPPSKEPVAAYTLDEGEGTTAADLTGLHNGTVEGAGWSEGKYGAALEFDGEADCLTVPDRFDLQLREAFTLEAWVRPSGVDGSGPIIYKESGGSFAYGLGLGMGPGSAYQPVGALGYGSSEATWVLGEEAIPKEAWSHVAMTFDGEKARLYVNSELMDSEKSPGAIASTGALRIGCAQNSKEFFGGRIDEIRLYNRALPAGEIEADSKNDHVAPRIELSGPLTEGLKEGTTNYPLHVHAIDGEVGRPGVGVKRIVISLDGEVVDEGEQECSKGSCSFDREWTLDTETAGFESHEITVEAEDVASNLESTVLPVPVPNGSLPACSLTGTASEVPPDETEELPGGGQNAIYHGSEGEEIQFPSPPSGFDPKKATDEELNLYGFPPRPPVSEPGPRGAWEETVGEAKSTAPPGACMGVTPESFAAEVSSSSGVEYRPNFAGWHTADPTGPRNEWSGASMQFAQPELQHTCHGAAAFVAWVGIGGPSGAFFQAGTTAPYEYSPEVDVSAFTEFFRAGHGKKLKKSEQPMHMNLEIAPTHPIFTEVIWKPASEEMIMWVQDLATHEAIHPRIRKAKENQVYDGRQLMFDIERPNGFQQENFGSVTFKKVRGLVTGRGWRPLDALRHRARTQMQNFAKEHPTDSLMSWTSQISNSDEFTETWHHCHP